MNENYVELVRRAIQALYDDMFHVHCLGQNELRCLSDFVSLSLSPRWDRFAWEIHNDADEAFLVWLEKVSK